MTTYQEYAEKPKPFLSLTGYTREEFDALLPHFSECFYDRMHTYRVDGKLRGNREYADYHNSPLPTVEDKLFFILTFAKTNNLQSVQGALFGISQPKANIWIHCLHPALNLALEHLDALPARYIEDVHFEMAKTFSIFKMALKDLFNDRMIMKNRKHFTAVKKTTHYQEHHIE